QHPDTMRLSGAASHQIESRCNSHNVRPDDATFHVITPRRFNENRPSLVADNVPGGQLQLGGHEHEVVMPVPTPETPKRRVFPQASRLGEVVAEKPLTGTQEKALCLGNDQRPRLESGPVWRVALSNDQGGPSSGPATDGEEARSTLRFGESELL